MKKAIIFLLSAACLVLLPACDYGADITVGGTAGQTSESVTEQTAETSLTYCGLTEDVSAPATQEQTGFALEKFSFESIEGFDELNEEQDLIDGLNEIHRVWQYTHDTVQFMFWFNGTTDMTAFESMNYEWIQEQSVYFPWVILEVAYENINLEALKALSQRSEVTHILINAPAVAVDE